MIVLVGELVVLRLLLKILPKEWYSAALRALVIVGLWSFAWLLLGQIELHYISPDGTYGSDARYYYQAMLSCLKEGEWWPPPGTLSPGYVAFGVLVLKTSPNDSVVWVKLANVGLLLIIAALGFHILNAMKVSKKTAYLTTLFWGTNGIVTWMAVRNLKDTLFLCLTVALLFLIRNVFLGRHGLFLNALSIVSLTFFTGRILEYVRPWGFYWAVVLLGSMMIELLNQQAVIRRRRRLPFVIAIIVVAMSVVAWFGLYYNKFVRDLVVAQIYAEQQGGLVGKNISDVILAVPRFLLGPGPIRALFGWEVFWVTTTIGNILIFLGSFAWWWYLPVFVLALLKGPKYWLKYAGIILPLLVFLGVYSFAYSGSLETRFRAVTYVLASFAAAPFLESALQDRKPLHMLVYFALLLIIWLGGASASYLSLMKW